MNLFLLNLFPLLILLTEFASLVINLKFCCLTMDFDFYVKFVCFMLMVVSNVVLIWTYYYSDNMSFKKMLILAMCIFVCFMYVLVISGDSLTLLIGWDALGFSSYLLIVFYWNWDVKYNGSFVMMTNKVGDCFILCILSNSILFGMNCTMIMLVSLLVSMIFLTSSTKSSHLPFVDWLPLSMSAPTPVSSLIHSSTLVCGGLILQSKFFIVSCTIYEMYINLLTLGYSITMSILESDTKKVVVFSTMNQVAIMGVLIESALIDIMYLHMLGHSFYKSSLFMQMANMMSISNHNQLMGFYQNMLVMGSKFSIFIMTLNLFSLMAFVYFGGFWSKDILMNFFTKMSLSYVVIISQIIILMMSILYCMKIMSCLMKINKSVGHQTVWCVFMENFPFVLSILGVFMNLFVLMNYFLPIVPFNNHIILLLFTFIFLYWKLFLFKSTVNFYSTFSLMSSKFLWNKFYFLDYLLEMFGHLSIWMSPKKYISLMFLNKSSSLILLILILMFMIFLL